MIQIIGAEQQQYSLNKSRKFSNYFNFLNVISCLIIRVIIVYLVYIQGTQKYKSMDIAINAI